MLFFLKWVHLIGEHICSLDLQRYVWKYIQFEYLLWQFRKVVDVLAMGVLSNNLLLLQSFPAKTYEGSSTVQAKWKSPQLVMESDIIMRESSFSKIFHPDMILFSNVATSMTVKHSEDRYYRQDGHPPCPYGPASSSHMLRMGKLFYTHIWKMTISLVHSWVFHSLWQ